MSIFLPRQKGGQVLLPAETNPKYLDGKMFRLSFRPRVRAQKPVFLVTKQCEPQRLIKVSIMREQATSSYGFLKVGRCSQSRQN